MSCIFRVGGKGFSAVEFLRGTGLRPYDVETDSFKLMVSESDELSDQIADATKFLRDHFTALEAWPRGKEISRTLDFSMFVPSFYEFPAQFLRWPAELLKLAGTLGIDIELSQYAVSDEAEEEEEQR